MNTIRVLGEEVEEAIVVRKILRTLPKRFNPKISFLEERTYLKSMIVDQLHGTLMAYEMRIEDEDTSRKEATFKISKQAGTNKSTKDKPTSDEVDDEEITNFVRKLKRGIGK